MTDLRVSALVAMDENRIIGSNNQLPWHIPEDLKRFKELTTGHTVVMGRKTYESIPGKVRPLPNRKNVVVSRTPESLDVPAGVDAISSVKEWLDSCREGTVVLPSPEIWIIGGAQIYEETKSLWDELYLTVVHSTHQGDVYFPRFEDSFELVSQEDRPGYSFMRYKRL
nr:Dihydrofolate reductase [uncultured bacterium]